MRFVLMLLLCTPGALGWGPAGHRVVALLAAERLSPGTAAQVRALLGGESMADASNWADDARKLPNWRHSAPWHYVNIPEGKTYKSSRKERRGDVIVALERFRKTLAKRGDSPQKRADALRFVIHFVADLHQPLHAGFAEDRGGNTVEVLWFGQRSNLHSVWDSGILGRRKISYKRLAESLERPSAKQAVRWAASGPIEWAAESQRLLPLVYRIGDGKLGEDYYEAGLPIVRERLTQAAVRLAAVLENALR